LYADVGAANGATSPRNQPHDIYGSVHHQRGIAPRDLATARVGSLSGPTGGKVLDLDVPAVLAGMESPGPTVRGAVATPARAGLLLLELLHDPLEAADCRQ
jgi:hypothetical protein